MLLDLRIIWAAWRLGVLERRWQRTLMLCDVMAANRAAIRLHRLEARRGSR